jgi:hypothetical protein
MVSIRPTGSGASSMASGAAWCLKPAALETEYDRAGKAYQWDAQRKSPASLLSPRAS